MNCRLLTMLILLALAPLALWFALSQGSLHISAPEMWLAFRGNTDNTTAYLVIHELRLPRALSVG